MEYSLPYLLIISFYLVLMVFNRFYQGVKTRNKIRFFCAFVFIIFFGCRGYIGSDWYNYNISYELTSWNEWLITDYEVAFSTLVKSLKFLGFNYFSIVLVITTFQVYLFDRFINKTCKNIILPYILLIALFPVVIIDLQRNFTSILIVMNAFLFLQRGNKRKYYLLILLAMLFHLSAVFFFFISYLNRVKFNTLVLNLLFVLGIIIYVLQIDFYTPILSVIENSVGGSIGGLINQVTREEEVGYGISVGIVEKLFLFIIIISKYKKVKQQNLLYVNFAVIYILIYLYFNTSQSFINRFANLFMFGYIWYYCFIFSNIKNKLYNFYYVLIIMFCLLRTSLSYNYEIYSYKNIIFEDEDYMHRIQIRVNHYEN